MHQIALDTVAQAGGSSLPPDLSPLDDGEFAALREIVREHTGIALNETKRPMLVGRLGRRLRHHDLRSFGAYVDLLREGDPDGEELRALVSRVTTHTTRFFREAHHFEFLQEQVFAAAHAPRTDPIRIWCCATSTGEEPYSLAMAAWESFGDETPARVAITATDIDQAVLQRARRGVYSARQLVQVPPARWRAHFLRGTGEATGLVQAAPRLRDLIDFRPLNLVAETWPVLGLFDVILCRNVIIYFDAAVRETLMDRLARHLAPGGHLLLGHSESLRSTHARLERVARTTYRLRDPDASREAPTGASARGGPPTKEPAGQRPGTRLSLAAGDVYVSAQGRVVRTCLGSCVAACLFDAGAGIGGMNHFALPTPREAGPVSCRYGIHAMEVLINELMKLGADRRRLQAKVFGASEILQLGAPTRSVAAQNTSFILDFLATEGIPLVARKLGGDRALEVLFDTGTGRARVRSVGIQHAASTLADEAGYRARLAAPGAGPNGCARRRHAS